MINHWILGYCILGRNNISLQFDLLPETGGCGQPWNSPPWLDKLLRWACSLKTFFCGRSHQTTALKEEFREKAGMSFSCSNLKHVWIFFIFLWLQDSKLVRGHFEHKEASGSTHRSGTFVLQESALLFWLPRWNVLHKFTFTVNKMQPDIQTHSGWSCHSWMIWMVSSCCKRVKSLLSFPITTIKTCIVTSGCFCSCWSTMRSWKMRRREPSEGAFFQCPVCCSLQDIFVSASLFRTF